MPSVAITSCRRCGVGSEHSIAQGPIPVISACECGGQRQILRILFRPRADASAYEGEPGLAARVRLAKADSSPAAN